MAAADGASVSSVTSASMFPCAGLFGLAFAEIVLLWGSIVATIVLFARHSRPAAALLVPYLAWVTFASALNLAI